jgi:hypothetical protein
VQVFAAAPQGRSSFPLSRGSSWAVQDLGAFHSGRRSANCNGIITKLLA